MGDKVRITTPPEYAYGSRDIGNGLIPPNSTLIFDIEVYAVNGDTANPVPEPESDNESDHYVEEPSNAYIPPPKPAENAYTPPPKP